MRVKWVFGRKHKWQPYAAILCISALALLLSPFLKAQDNQKYSILRNRIFNLRHISAKDAREHLINLKLGRDINQIPNMNALIVTSSSSADLNRATTLMNLIDTEQPFTIKTILYSPDPEKLPSIEQIDAQIEDISIGTFKDPPVGTNKPLAIVDMHNSDLIVIAPVDLIDRITETIKNTQAPPPKPKEETKEPLHVEPPIEKQQPPQPVTEPKPETEKQPEPILEPAREQEEILPQEQEEEDVLDIELFKALLESEQTAAEPESKNETELPQPETVEPINQIAEPEKDDVSLEDLLASFADENKKPDAAFDQQKTPPVKQPEETIAPVKTDKPLISYKIYPVDNANVEQLAQTLRNIIAPNITDENINIVADTNSSSIIITAGQEHQQQLANLIGSLDVQPKIVVPDITQPEDEDTNQPERPARKRVVAPTAIRNSEKELELSITLPEKIEIITLIELVGKQLGLNYIYDPKEIKGQIMLKIHDGKIKVKDTYTLLESVLKFKSMVMTRRGNLVTIVPKGKAMQIDPTFRASTEQIQPGDVIVITTFQLNYIDTDSAMALLKNMNLGESITPIRETKTLMITEYAYRMKRITEVLEMVDVPGEPRLFKFRELKYTLAANLTPKIKTLAEQMGDVSVTISAKPAKAAKPRRGSKAKTPTPARPSSAKASAGIYLDTDERTNRILMIGIAEDIDTVNTLIDALDVEQQDMRSIQQYEIQYVGAEEIKEKLEALNIISTSSQTSGRSARRSSVRQQQQL